MPPSGPFDFTQAMTRLCVDITSRVDEFAHIHADDDNLAEGVRFQIVRYSRTYKADRAYRHKVHNDWQERRASRR